MNLTQEEFEALSKCQSEAEWSRLCDEIKRARGGQYPEDWYSRILGSGVMARVTKSWGGAEGMRPYQ